MTYLFTLSESELLALKSMAGEYVRLPEKIESFVDVVNDVDVTPESLLVALLDPTRLVRFGQVLEPVMAVHRDIGTVRSVLDRVVICRTSEHDAQDQMLSKWQAQLFQALGELTHSDLR
jgi:hypothetical protein